MDEDVVRMDSFAHPFPPKMHAWQVGTMLAELGLADDAPWIRIFSNGAIPPGKKPIPLTVEGAIQQTLLWSPPPADRKQWAGYSFEYVGVLAKTPSSTTLFFEWHGDDFTITAQILRQRHGHPDSILYAQLVTAPGQLRRGTIENTHLEYSQSPEDRRRQQRRAWHAAGLAHINLPDGRPPRFLTKGHAVNAILKMYARVDGWKSTIWTVESASDEKLAGWLGCSVHTLRGLDRPGFDITPDDIRSRRL